MAHYDIFREQLGTTYPAYGHALWDPNPGKLYGPVEVGDVGYVREGKFHRLFNALLPADHPSHLNFGVPEYYEPLSPERLEHIDTGTESLNHFCSQGITMGDAPPECLETPEDFSQVSYWCRRRQRGAALYLPIQAQYQNTVARGAFGEWLIKHIESWFAFTQQLGLGLAHMEDIILVTGCHRTRSWLNVAFLGSPSHTDSQISFQVGVTDKNSPQVGVNWRLSPDRIRGALISQGPDGKNLPEDNCVFIRGFRVTRTLRILPKHLIAAAGPSSDPDGHSSEPEFRLTSIPSITKHRDPLHILLEYIAERVPDCELVLVHDDDLAWISEACNSHSNEPLQSDTVMPLLQKYQPKIQQILCETGRETTTVAMFSEEFQKWDPSQSGILQENCEPKRFSTNTTQEESTSMNPDLPPQTPMIDISTPSRSGKPRVAQLATTGRTDSKSETMSYFSPPSPPSPPGSFPLPFPNPIATTSTPRNPPHLPEGYLLWHVPHPQQGPVSPPTLPVPSLPGGYASSHSSGPARPPSMMQRAATLPITGQVNYAQPVPYQNVPASGITQQSSHSGGRMPESDRDVSGGRIYRDDGLSEGDDLEQSQDATSDMSGYGQRRTKYSINYPIGWGRSRSRRSEPQPRQPDLPCRLCGHSTLHREYTRLGGFCSNKHRREWYEGPPCRLCRNLTQGGTYERYGGYCSASHRDATPCKWCEKMTPRLDYDHFDGFCSQNHRDEAKFRVGI